MTEPCWCPDPLCEVHPGCPLHGHSPEAYVEPASEREEAIGRIMRRTGKTREQAVAFLDILGSAFRKRGWAEGEPLDEPQIAERLDTFLGDADGT